MAINKVHVNSIMINIRAYEEAIDLKKADELEKVCEAGTSSSTNGGKKKMSLFTDLLGDPLCRIRQYPSFQMLVAETLPDKKMVGLVRAGVKEVVSSCTTDNKPTFVSIAYILGLRVHPTCRRMGIGEGLVRKMEEWCRDKGRAEYVYIATERDNEASLNLFTKKLGYIKFRNPAILVQPVYVAEKNLSAQSIGACRFGMKKKKKKKNPRTTRGGHVSVVELSPEEAERLYTGDDSACTRWEFYPRDMSTILASKLHKGTWLASYTESESESESEPEREPKSDPSEPKPKPERRDSLEPSSWAALSLWKCNEIYHLQMKGASLCVRMAAAFGRFAGRVLETCSRGTAPPLPTLPDLFDRPFGIQLIYGVLSHGPRGPILARHLAWHAHNLARRDGCAAIAMEIAGCDPLRQWMPHWTEDEDLWCLKRLNTSTTPSSHDPAAHVSASDWSTSQPPPSLFLDPRDF